MEESAARRIVTQPITSELLNHIMMEKELFLAIAGYSLVRGVQMAAARQANLEPRKLSFSRVQALIMTALPRLAAVSDSAQWDLEYHNVSDIGMQSCTRCPLSARAQNLNFSQFAAD